METNNNVNLKTEKSFSVKVETLFNAWTNPEQLKQWWKPMGHQLTEVVNELREGGRIEYNFKTDDIKFLSIKGEYSEVILNEKLAYTWNWQVQNEALNDSEYKLIIDFKTADNGSKIEITQENNKEQESIHPHHHGWEEALNHLAEYLSSKGGVADEEKTNADQEQSSDQGSQDPATV